MALCSSVRCDKIRVFGTSPKVKEVERVRVRVNGIDRKFQSIRNRDRVHWSTHPINRSSALASFIWHTIIPCVICIHSGKMALHYICMVSLTKAFPPPLQLRKTSRQFHIFRIVRHICTHPTILLTEQNNGFAEQNA